MIVEIVLQNFILTDDVAFIVYGGNYVKCLIFLLYSLKKYWIVRYATRIVRLWTDREEERWERLHDVKNVYGGIKNEVHRSHMEKRNVHYAESITIFVLLLKHRFETV